MALHPPPPPPRAVGGAGVVPLGAGGGGGPRIIPTAGAPAATLPGNGMTLDALMARQKELAGRTVEMPEMRSPWQGVAYAAQQGLQGFQAGRAERDAQQGRDALAQAISGIDTTTGELAPDLMTSMAALDPSMAAALKQAQLERTWRVQDREDTQAAAAALEAEKLKGTNAAKLTDKATLRGDYTGDLSYKNWQNAAPMWNSMQDAASRNTSQSDLNMVIAMAKMFDPGSVVRREEGEAVQDTAGLPQGLYGKFLYLTGQKGSRLAPEVRQGMMEEAFSRMSGYHEELAKHHKWITGIAGRNGIDPYEITGDLPELAPWAPAKNDPNKPPVPAPATPDTPAPAEPPAPTPASKIVKTEPQPDGSVIYTFDDGATVTQRPSGK